MVKFKTNTEIDHFRKNANKLIIKNEMLKGEELKQ